jgi:hypothetical protein
MIVHLKPALVVLLVWHVATAVVAADAPQMVMHRIQAGEPEADGAKAN